MSVQSESASPLSTATRIKCWQWKCSCRTQIGLYLYLSQDVHITSMSADCHVSRWRWRRRSYSCQHQQARRVQHLYESICLTCVSDRIRSLKPTTPCCLQHNHVVLWTNSDCVWADCHHALFWKSNWILRITYPSRYFLRAVRRCEPSLLPLSSACCVSVNTETVCNEPTH